jgi:hypothetical protein
MNIRNIEDEVYYLSGGCSDWALSLPYLEKDKINDVKLDTRRDEESFARKSHPSYRIGQSWYKDEFVFSTKDEAIDYCFIKIKERMDYMKTQYL